VNIGFFPLKFRLFSRTLPSLAKFKKVFKKCLTTFYPKSLFFFLNNCSNCHIDWSFGSVSVDCPVVKIELSKVGPFFKEPVMVMFFVDPQQVVLMLTRLRAVWHVLLSNFENFSQQKSSEEERYGHLIEFMPFRTTCPRNFCKEWNHPRLPCRQAHQGA